MRRGERLGRLAVPALLAAGLAACDPAPSPVPAAPPPTTSAEQAGAADAAPVPDTQWRCGGKPVAARFDIAAGTVTLVHDRGQLILPQAIAASGARYADANGNEFWTKGSTGTLTFSGMPAKDCAEAPATDAGEAER